MTIKDTKIVSEVLKNGGLTLNPRTMQPIKEIEGYMVSLEGYEVVIDIKDFNKAVIDKYLNAGFKRRNIDGFYCPNTYLGFWVNDGKVYMDVSTHLNDLDIASAMGMAWNQKAIWDVKNKVEIFI